MLKILKILVVFMGYVNQLGVLLCLFSSDAMNIDFCTAQNHTEKHHVAHRVTSLQTRILAKYAHLKAMPNFIHVTVPHTLI